MQLFVGCAIRVRESFSGFSIRRYKKGPKPLFKWILFVVYDLSEIWFQGSAAYKTAVDVSLSE